MPSLSCQPRSSLTGDSRFSSDSRLCTISKSPHSPFSHHTHPPLPIIPLLLSIHLFVRAPSPSCLLIVVVLQHTIYFPAEPAELLPGPTLFSSVSGALVGRPPGCSKQLSHTQFHLRAGAARQGISPADDGAQSSFLSPHKSVGGLRPIV